MKPSRQKPSLGASLKRIREITKLKSFSTYKDVLKVGAETDLLLQKAADNNLEIPKLDHKWKDRLESLAEGGLLKQRAAAMHDMRVEQAEQMGFVKMPKAEAVELLMDEKHTDYEEKPPRINYNYVYLHLEDKVEGPDTMWGFEKPEHYTNNIKRSFWFSKKVWEVTMVVNLDKLKKQIPHKVVIGINGLKRIKFFNAFLALQNEDGDAIIMGCLWELPPKDDGSPSSNSNRANMFYLAKI